MIEKKLQLKSKYLFIILAMFSNFCGAQDCGLLTQDSITNPGKYDVATMTESDGLRNGPNYNGATIYYPTNASPPFSSIVFVPGFISVQSSIQDWGPFFASHGIVTMTIGTNSLFDDPILRGEALLDAITTIMHENLRTNSPLFGKLDTNRIAVGGWSMGGGGAQLAAAADSTIEAVVALTPWLNSNQLSPSDLNHSVPLLIFSGELDPTAPPSIHANIHYDYTPETTNKLIFEIDNGNHSVANTPTGGQDDVGKIALSWLKQYLIGDSCYCPFLIDTPSTSSNYMTTVDCPQTTTSNTSIINNNTFSYQLYPNPSRGIINLEVENIEQRMEYEINSITGVKLLSGELVSQITTIDSQSLPAGIYIINVLTTENSKSIQFIVL